jgi:hypothetical protein
MSQSRPFRKSATSLNERQLPGIALRSLDGAYEGAKLPSRSAYQVATDNL